MHVFVVTVNCGCLCAQVCACACLRSCTIVSFGFSVLLKLHHIFLVAANSVGIPYKEAVMEFCNEVHPLAEVCSS